MIGHDCFFLTCRLRPFSNPSSQQVMRKQQNQQQQQSRRLTVYANIATRLLRHVGETKWSLLSVLRLNTSCYWRRDAIFWNLGTAGILLRGTGGERGQGSLPEGATVAPWPLGGFCIGTCKGAWLRLKGLEIKAGSALTGTHYLTNLGPLSIYILKPPVHKFIQPEGFYNKPTHIEEITVTWTGSAGWRIIFFILQGGWFCWDAN